MKKAMIDLKIPRHLRDTYPVIDADGSVVAVYGIGCDESFAAADTNDLICITVTETTKK